MYELTLTHSERQAMDWVGFRYPHGDELMHLLWVECESIPNDRNWSDDGDIIFKIPEHTAWEIHTLLTDSDFDCFSSEFEEKLRTFLGKIV